MGVPACPHPAAAPLQGVGWVALDMAPLPQSLSLWLCEAVTGQCRGLWENKMKVRQAQGWAQARAPDAHWLMQAAFLLVIAITSEAVGTVMPSGGHPPTLLPTPPQHPAPRPLSPAPPHRGGGGQHGQPCRHG